LPQPNKSAQGGNDKAFRVPIMMQLPSVDLFGWGNRRHSVLLRFQIMVTQKRNNQIFSKNSYCVIDFSIRVIYTGL
jgi:hypothetical protein